MPDEGLFCLKDFCKLVGVPKSRSGWLRIRFRDEFPRPLVVGGKHFWTMSDVETTKALIATLRPYGKYRKQTKAVGRG